MKGSGVETDSGQPNRGSPAKKRHAVLCSRPREMRTIPFFSLSIAACLIAPVVEADDDPNLTSDEFSHLVLDTGRLAPPKPHADWVHLTVHGEAQLRGQLERSFPLDVTATTKNTNPGAIEDSIGQNAFITSWIRLTPRLLIKDTLAITAQLDILQGFIFGQTAHGTWPDQYARDNGGDWGTWVGPRWLFLDWRTPYGLFRIGQQPNHWGMGVLANDGDHPSVFGDYRGGQISERILFGTKPAGKDSPFTIAIAGDLVYRDWSARLSRGDIAWQGVLAGYWERGYNQLGVFSVIRSQSTSKQSGADYNSYSDTLSAGIVDVAGKFATPVPGSPSMYVFGAGELAAVFGSTNQLRDAQQAATGHETTIRSYGGAAQLGVVHVGSCVACERGQQADKKGSPITWGDFVAQLEVGYASGDSDPYDRTERRFTFDPNHKVGLVLFDEVMRWQTARASAAAQDPLLSNSTRPTPGANLLPSNGGVFGAQYIYPTMIVRPVHNLDLKVGAVVAQTTADLVDPYRVATQGAYVNYRGGDTRRHDLGLELDGGVEWRNKLDRELVLQLGAQAGVLFPGGALADASGQTMKTPWLAVLRVGLQF